MKKIISLIAVAVAALSLASCQKLQPSEIPTDEWISQATAVIVVTKDGVPQASAPLIITTSDGRRFDATTGADGKYTQKFGTGAAAVTVTAQCTIYAEAFYLQGSGSKSINAGGVGKVEVKLAQTNL